MRVRPVFAWYDWWVGGYWDRKRHVLYLMVPFVGLKLHFHTWEPCDTPPARKIDPPCPFRRCSSCGQAHSEHYWSGF